MSDNKPARRSLTLSEAREQTPPVNPVEAMRRQLAVSLFGGVGEADMVAMATKLKEMALAGDLKAARMLIDLVMPKEPKPAPAPQQQPSQDSAGLKMMAEVLQDLVDEIRIGKAMAENREGNGEHGRREHGRRERRQLAHNGNGGGGGSSSNGSRGQRDEEEDE